MARATTPNDDGTEPNDEPAEITDYSDENLHARLSGRLQDLRDATGNARDSFTMTAERYNEETGLVSISIESDESIFNEGEIGADSFHIILGPQGGVHTARKRSMLTEPRDYLDEYPTVSMAWKVLLSAVRGAA